MEDLKQLNTLITQVYQVSNKINKDNLLEKMFGENKDLLEKVSILEKDLNTKCRELENLKLKYDTDIGHKNNELIEKSEELKNFTKVSFISSLNKQINDKNLIIQQLENQIFKLKANNNVNTSKTWVVEEKKTDQVINQTSEQIVSEVPVTEQSNSEQPIIEEKLESVQVQESTEKPKKKKKEKQVIENPVVDTVTEEIVIDKPVVEETIEDQKVINAEQEGVQEPTEKPKKKKKEKQVVEEQVIEIEKEPVEEPNEKPKKKKSKNTEPVVEEEQQPLEEEQQPLEEEPIEEEIIKETTDKKKKKKEKQAKPFDPEDFEDVNGYELITYKKNYYLRDLETNELYSIVDNNPGEVVGLLSNSGKVKLN